MQDRLEIPASLEKALEYGKQEPGDQRVNKHKARDWEAVVKRGRRALFWSRLKPVTAVLAGAAVVAAVVLSWPMQEELKQGAADKESAVNTVQTTPAPSVDEEFKRKQMAYLQQGYQLINFPHSVDLDLISDKEGVYAVKKGEGKKQILPLQKGDWVFVYEQVDVKGVPYAFITQYKPSDINDRFPNDSLFMLNLANLTVRPIPIPAGKVMYSNYVNTQAPQLIYAMTHQADGKHQTVRSYDLQTGEDRQLYETTKAVERFAVNGTTVAVGHRDEIVLISEDRVEKVVQSEKKDLELIEILGDSSLLYIEGVRDSMNPRGGTYKGTEHLMRYDMKTGKSSPLLPNVEGDQYMVMRSPFTNGALVVANFIPDKGIAQPDDPFALKGILQLWCVYPDQSKRTYLMYEKSTTWGAHWLRSLGSINESNRYLLMQDNSEWALIYDDAYWSITETDPKTAKEKLNK